MTVTKIIAIFKGNMAIMSKHEHCHHKVRMYKEYHSACSLAGIGTLSSECAPPSRTGGVAHSPAGEGLGESQYSDDWRKSLALYLLCDCHVSRLGLSFVCERYEK
jgi:hypothetical protein